MKPQKESKTPEAHETAFVSSHRMSAEELAEHKEWLRKHPHVVIKPTRKDWANEFRNYADRIIEDAERFAFRQNDPARAERYDFWRELVQRKRVSARKQFPNSPALPEMPSLTGNDFYALADYCTMAADVLDRGETEDGAAAHAAGDTRQPAVASKSDSYWPDPDFLEAVADEVHGLFLPPAPPANLEHFNQRVSAAIDQKNRHDAAEAELWRKIDDHYEKIKQDRRLRDKKAGPPKKGWVWVEGFRDDRESKHLDGWAPPKLARRVKCKGWAWDDPIPLFGKLQSTPPEIILLGQYVILAIVHDNSDTATNRGRPRLLDGFSLPRAFAVMRDYGLCKKNGMRMTGFDRKGIERALEDVKIDLKAAVLHAPSVAAGPRSKGRRPDRLIQLIEQALDHRPSKFDADPCRYLGDHGLFESNMPIWYRGGSRGPLDYELKKWAAPFIVWLRRWVKPLLEELASEPSATKVLLDALPPPLPVPCRVKEDGRIEPVDEQAREAFNTTFDVPPVHLWQLWRRWKPVTGLDGMPDVPPYPGAVCPPKAIRKGCRYKSGVPDSSGTEGNGNCSIYENCPWRFSFALVCGPFNTLAVSHNAPNRVTLVCDALNWLRRALVDLRDRLHEARSDEEQPESAMTVKDILEAVRAIMQEAAPPTGTQTTSKPTLLKKPPKVAFVAYALYERYGNQEEVAKALRQRFGELCDRGIIDAKQRSTVGQWDVSKWCKAVKQWREAGNPMPSPDEFKPSETIQTVDPKVLDMGPRGDHHTSRQRANRDPDSIDDWD